MSQEVFRALCDAQAANYFNFNGVNGTVDNAWAALQQQRNPNTTPGPNDQPFWSLLTTNSTGDLQYPPRNQNPLISGLEATVLRSSSPGSGSLLVNNPAGWQGPTSPPAHPYIQQELLRKIYGNLTTRSNTFAVHITVGFFDVRGTPGVDWGGAFGTPTYR